MILNQKVAVTMPAYYAEKTLEKTVAEIPRDIADEIIVVDDASKDRTTEIAQGLGITSLRNETNLNYGGNVKRCLQAGLDSGADIVILLHPDYQYTPKLIPAMAGLLSAGFHDLCLGSRTSGVGALRSGMPIWRYLANWGLTNVMDVCFGTHHTEYHTGYRAYTRKLLETVPFHEFSNDFIFDNEMFVAALRHGFQTCEVTCPTVYEEDSSSISFSRAVEYGLRCLKLAIAQFGWRISSRLSGSRPVRES